MKTELRTGKSNFSKHIFHALALFIRTSLRSIAVCNISAARIRTSARRSTHSTQKACSELSQPSIRRRRFSLSLSTSRTSSRSFDETDTASDDLPFAFPPDFISRPPLPPLPPLPPSLLLPAPPHAIPSTANNTHESDSDQIECEDRERAETYCLLP